MSDDIPVGIRCPHGHDEPSECLSCKRDRSFTEQPGVSPPGPTCSECNWSNTNLLNLGEPGKSRMVCQGCAKRGLEQRDAALDALRFVKQHAVFPLGVVAACRPANPWDKVDAALAGKAGSVSLTWPYVERFAAQMEAKLLANAHKGGPKNWLNDDVWRLMERLGAEEKELRHAIESGSTAAIVTEAADVANFAMMVASWFEERAMVLADIDATD